MTGRSIAWRISGFLAVLPMLLGGCAGGPSARTELLPAPASYFTAIVQSGDSGPAIARRYRVREDDLLAMNDFANGEQLRTGTRIRIPAYAPVRSESDRVVTVSEPRETERSLPAPPKAAPTKPVQITQAAPPPRSGD